MQVRPIQPDDKAAVIDLWRRAGLTRPWNDPEKDIERKMSVQPEWFLVGLLNDKIVATAMVGYDGHRGWINYLAVDPEHRRAGFGRLLMERAELILQDFGCPKINLQIRKDNQDAIRFYESIGFSEDAVLSYGKRLIPDVMQADAKISACEKYRYVLRRVWEDGRPTLGIVGLNPSVADATVDDSTLKKCMKFAKSWGYGGIVLVNLFSWRATDKSEIRVVSDPVGPENDRWVVDTLSEVEDVLCAWGNDGAFLDRSKAVCQLIKPLAKRTLCIRQNSTGEPAHPLYQRDDSALQPFSLERF